MVVAEAVVVVAAVHQVRQAVAAARAPRAPAAGVAGVAGDWAAVDLATTRAVNDTHDEDAMMISGRPSSPSPPTSPPRLQELLRLGSMRPMESQGHP